MIKFDGDLSVVIKNTAELFLGYKKKAVFNHVITARPIINKNNGEARTIEFYDERIDPPYKVGAMWWDGDSYVIDSDRIRNEKYAKWNSQFHTKSTGDIKRAIKNALENIKPFDWSMVAKAHGDDVKTELRHWVNKPTSVIAEAISYTITKRDLHAELEAALKEGRQFISDGMNKAKQIMQDNLDEATRRTELNLQALFVTTDEHGRYVSDKWATPKLEGELPEDVLTKMGLLKIMDLEEGRNKSKVIDEVGVRIGANVFWVFINTDTMKLLTDKPEA